MTFYIRSSEKINRGEYTFVENQVKLWIRRNIFLRSERKRAFYSTSEIELKTLS